MNKVVKLSLTLSSVVVTAFMLTSCSGVGSIAQSESYKVGYDLGVSGSIGQMIFYGQAGGPSEACASIFDLSVAGTTNDGIDWASLDRDQYLDGCMDGQLEAHPDADWNN